MASRIQVVLLASLAMAVLAPGSAGAQTRNWDGDAAACNAGVLQSCMSFQVSLSDVLDWHSMPMGETEVTMRVQNLQSADGVGDPWSIPGWIQLGGLRFAQDVFFDVGTTASVGYAGTATTVGDPNGVFGGRWLALGTAGSDNGQTTRQAQPDDGGRVIGGCKPLTPYFYPGGPKQNVPLYGFEPGYFQTCGDAWVTFDFILPTFAFSDETFLTVSGSAGPGTPNNTYSLGLCTSGADCPTTVTPEPGTILLVGTGLIALGGAMALRRRHEAAHLVGRPPAAS